MSAHRQQHNANTDASPTAATSEMVHVHTQMNLGNANILCDPVKFTSDIAETHVHRDVLRVMSTPNLRNPSLVIPSVHKSITRKDIFELFRTFKLGHIDTIQFMRGKSGRDFVPVYIHYLFWYDNDDANKVKRKLLNGGFKVKYDDAHPNRFWMVRLSELPKPMPSISHEPRIRWYTRKDEDSRDLIEEFESFEDNADETLPSEEGKELCLVIPRVRKGYTAEHIRWVFRQLCLFKDDDEDDIRVTLFFPKKEARGSAVAYMTAYIHVKMNSQRSASYFYNFLDDIHTIEIIHDVRPKTWSWIVRKSDIDPTKKTHGAAGAASTSDTTTTSNDNNRTVLSKNPTIEL